MWQTGSGTQSNMNVNEVVANRGNELAGKKAAPPQRPREHVPELQRHLPTAMHIAAAVELEDRLFPRWTPWWRPSGGWRGECRRGEIGAHPSQDAVPITLAQEMSGWRTILEKDRTMLELALPGLQELAPGRHRGGHRAQRPQGLCQGRGRGGERSDGKGLRHRPQQVPRPHQQGRAGLCPRALKALAGPDENRQRRALAGLPAPVRPGEIQIPENEPGSSIMPGKVNPTQCEAVTMVAVQVMANDVAGGPGGLPGQLRAERVHAGVHLQLPPVRRRSPTASAPLTTTAPWASRPTGRMPPQPAQLLMLVTALNPYIGYDNAAKTAKKAHAEHISLKEACVSLGFLTAERFDEVFHPEEMV